MELRKFRCYAFRENSNWQAICTDLDISVQGNSLEDAKLSLEEAVSGFLEVLEGESEADRRRLLNRRSPTLLRTLLYMRDAFYHLKSENSLKFSFSICTDS